MITCEEVGELLLAYRDGDLDADGTEILRQHLHRCPPCLDLLSDYQEVVALLARLRPVKMPEGLLERLKRGCQKGLDEPTA